MGFGSKAIIRTNLLVPFITSLVGCPSEELIFRGFIQNNLNKKYNKYITIVLTSLFFGFIHGSLLNIILTFIIGIYFSYIVYKTSNIYITIIGHFFTNIVLVSFITKMFGTSFSGKGILLKFALIENMQIHLDGYSFIICGSISLILLAINIFILSKSFNKNLEVNNE